MKNILNVNQLKILNFQLSLHSLIQLKNFQK